MVTCERDTADTWSIHLRARDDRPLAFEPGQFTMIGRLGVGEVPISVSGDPDDADLVQTVRDVGGVTHTLVSSAPGDTVEPAAAITSP